jgi:multicomponent Na+:H+ antiporter subunit G
VIEIIDAILYYTGMILVFLGGILDIIASIGMNRFKNFYLRLHAATIGSIGGGFYPLIGIGLVALTLPNYGSLKYYVAGIAFTTAFFLLITSPTGSHALAQGAHKSRVVMPEPAVIDRLKEDEEKEGEKK